MYRTSSELETWTVAGYFNWYPGGGYVAELGLNAAYTKHVLESLKRQNWVDKNTSAVFLEFTLFNPPTSLFSIVVIIFEFHGIGKVYPVPYIYACNLYHYTSKWDTVTAVFEVLVLLFIPCIIYNQIKKFKKHGMPYFHSFWNLLQIALILLALSCVIAFIYRVWKVSQILDKRGKTKGQVFLNFYPVAIAHYTMSYLMAFLIVILTVQLIRLLSFSKRMLISLHVLRNASSSLILFIALLLSIVIGIAAIAVSTFGPSYEGFHSVTYTIVNVIGIAMSEFSFRELQESSPIMGPVFYVALVMSFYFILTPIFIAILDHSLREIRRLHYHLESEIEMMENIWNLFLRKSGILYLHRLIHPQKVTKKIPSISEQSSESHFSLY